MYPEASNGFKRICIPLEPQENELLFKIELIPGKKMNVDCNRHHLTGELVQKSVQGWGYPYFIFETNGMVMSTKMACPEGELHERFVEAESKLVRYNSKLPIIVLIPDDCDIEYRIWQGNEIPLKGLKG